MQLSIKNFIAPDKRALSAIHAAKRLPRLKVINGIRETKVHIDIIERISPFGM